ncbi:type VI secretion system-associated protein VasI [Pseudomonas vanderleydeniana]|uniref:Type VI secretion system-associated protein TagO n=1 Tax=Pseudomonas vanderleydeniana TaxID=2745495 RepID=A0A9E6PQF8_9PSED|nr:type VI secretion system-associated protein VasI [Pseudomonas vanderleydeniana]QXI30587.1 type VI secretion system-associated protein TagO [Pseudomonas vanderleydeniana]
MLLVLAVAEVQAMPVSQDCPAIVSSLKRLECFDRAAGTPARLLPVPPVASGPVPAIVELARQNETGRQPGDGRFLISSQPEPTHPHRLQVVASAPALGVGLLRPLLVISCEAQITRLQLVLEQAPKPNTIRIQLFNDERPVAPAHAWRVLDSGLVVDAGRGLPAIALLRQMGGGQRLRLASDYPALDGLLFDAEGLGELIEQERQACRW